MELLPLRTMWEILLGIFLLGLGYLIRGNNSSHIKRQLHFIIQKLNKMSAELEAIKADLVAAQELQVKIAADVQRLHDTITALGDAPTAQELADLKALSGALVSSLQATDDATPE